MDKKFLQPLELDKIIKLLSDYCASDAAKEMALALEPSSDIKYVESELAKTDDAFTLSVAYGTPTFINIRDMAGSLKRAGSGAKLSLRELMDIGRVLKQIGMLSDWHRHSERIDTPLAPLFNSLVPHCYLEEKLETSIVSEEEVADSASSELASIRRKISQASQRIRETLDKMIRSQSMQKHLQESLVTLRDGRYVVPVKAESKASVPGLVHDTSASGATYFIEPIAVVEANNDIRVLKGRELDEIDRIIKELSAECAGVADSIIEDFHTCVQLNLYFAKSNYGAKLRGIIPKVNDEGRVTLKNARHPLINQADVVPVSLQLGADYNALVITGPNTGGKTVALKTVGLLTAMTMCGMMIPASEGSEIAMFERILVDIGDNQSIEQSLSTFSSHMNKVVEILKLANHSSLILLDELGSGTDPVEGAALAVAVLEDLQRKKSRMLVTTHYQELKVYALEHEGIENASCEFDVATLRPTYRLILGSPGKSNAFAISSRLGLTDEVISRAKELVSEENLRLEKVIAQLEKTRIELEEAREEQAKLVALHKTELETFRKEKEAFEANKEGEMEKARQQAMSIVSRVRGQSELLMDELNAIRKEQDKERFAAMAISAKGRVRSALDSMYNDANPVMSRSNEGYVLPRPLEKGDSVFLVDFDRKGVLLGTPDSGGQVFVQSGAMRTKVKADRLRLLDKETSGTGRPAVKRTPKASKGDKSPGLDSKLTRSAAMELDIRGCMTDEGVHMMEQFLNNAVMSGMGIVTIIHGKGTGALRQAVHRSLKSHPSVKGYRLGTYGEGEDGVTVVELK